MEEVENPCVRIHPAHIPAHPKPPPLIGVTGGIGTGKSTVTRMLSELGAATFSADDVARDVLAPGSEALAKVAAALGAEVIQPDGTLDRQRVAAIVFNDSAARRNLEEISHPRILARLRQQVEEAARRNPPPSAVVVEAPLLFEAGMDDWFDHIIVVTAPEDLQVTRASDRSHITREEALSRIRAQMPLAEKAARADYVVENADTLESLRESVRRLWPILLATPRGG
jgi:dephospho-CoA kinase